MERKRIIVITPEERKYLQKMIGCSGVTVWEEGVAELPLMKASEN